MRFPWHRLRHFILAISALTIAFLTPIALAGFVSFATMKGAVAQGAGDLIVSPTRVVFEGRTRAAQLALSNRGSETATYRISIVNMKMSETGQVTEISRPEPGQKFAESLFRYSPRQITLEPGASQAIRILLRKPADLAAGEYRSHIMMRAVPNIPSQSVESAQPGAATVQLIPVFGIAIPVIVRHGELDYGVDISNVAYVPGSSEEPQSKIRFDLNRTGERSSFGDVVVSVKEGDESVVLAQALRLAVYTPNTSRTVELNLRVPDGFNISGKTVTVDYNAIADEGGQNLASGSAVLP